MRLHHLALGPARARISQCDVPGGVAAATADLPSKTLCPQSPASRRQLLATSVQPMCTHWCRRHPGWHLPINELWHRASRPCAPGEGTLVVCVVALANQSAGGCLVCRGTPDHAIQCVQRQTCLPAVASGLLVRPMGSSVAKQPLQGLTAPAVGAPGSARWMLMGSLCCPGSASSSTSATFTMERSLSKATPNTSQSACSMGSRRLRSVATPSSARPVQSHCWGMLL